MNIAFWILVLIGTVLLWFAMSDLFKAIGDFFLYQFNKAKEEMKIEKDEGDCDQ